MSSPVTNIPIPAILMIREGAALKLEHTLKKYGFREALFIFDEFTYKTFKQHIQESLQSIKMDVKILSDDLDINALIQIAFQIKQYDVIVAVGGGTIIDYGKYIAFCRRIPFISIPTSASNDGFASSNCSLIVNGKKTTVPARVPYGIIADLDIIQHAPKRFILAGIGDLMSNITALYDWEFEEQNGASSVHAFAYMISKKAVNSFIRTPMEDITNTILLKELVSSLTMGGISTVMSGNSSPISGSEHLISHALDQISVSPEMHGIQVGLATYIMANVQNHRAERMKKVFTRTGFFDYAKTLQLKMAEYKEAIEMASSIKPNRYTYLHETRYKKQALEFLDRDPILNSILH